MYGTKKIAKSAIVIMMFLLSSKFLGFFRDILIASRFGSGVETDAYFVASTSCVFFVGIIGYGLSITLVPIISGMDGSIKNKSSKGKLKGFGILNISGNANKVTYNYGYDGDWNKNINIYINTILNTTILFALLITVITWFGSPLLIRIFAKGFRGEQFQLAVSLTRIGIPMIILTACNSVFTGFLQGKEKLNTTVAIGIPYNIVFIIFLIFFSKEFGIKGLMIASVIAVFSQFLLQLFASYKIKFSYKFQLNFRNRDVKKTFYIITPVVLGSMVDKINTLIDKTLASELTKGSISALNYSNTINSLILNVFVIGITTVIYPILSKEFVNKNTETFKKILIKSINVILIVIIPTTIGIMVLSTPIIRLLLERGAFDSNATEMTSLALLFYSIGLIGVSLRNILDKTFYSFKDAKTPMRNGILTVGVNIILNLILVKPMAHLGLALATSIAEIFGALLLFFSLRNKIGSIGIKHYAIYLMKLGLAAGVMGIVIYFISNFFIYMGANFLIRLAILMITIFIGTIIYSILCYVLGIEEVKIFFKYIRNLLKNPLGIFNKVSSDKNI